MNPKGSISLVSTMDNLYPGVGPLLVHQRSDLNRLLTSEVSDSAGKFDGMVIRQQVCSGTEVDVFRLH